MTGAVPLVYFPTQRQGGVVPLLVHSFSNATTGRGCPSLLCFFSM